MSDLHSAVPGMGLQQGVERPPRRRGQSFLAAVAALLKLLLYLATAALAAGIVSYYLMSVQLPRETSQLRNEIAALRTSVESMLEAVPPPGRPGSANEGVPGTEPGTEPEPGTEEPGPPPQPGDTPDVPQEEPGTDGPGGDEPGIVEPGPDQPDGAVRQHLLVTVALLSGQSQLAVAMGDVARHDLGTAAQMVGQIAATWEQNEELAALAGQAWDCQARLAAGDTRGTYLLRLLWYETKREFEAALERLDAAMLR